MSLFDQNSEFLYDISILHKRKELNNMSKNVLILSGSPRLYGN